MNDLIEHLKEQMAFSFSTFGHGERTEGIIAHIRKELDEIAKNPGDIFEWIDVVILAFDGAWRAGWEPEQIAAALREKLAINKARHWPDWKNAQPGQPIEHVRSIGCAQCDRGDTMLGHADDCPNKGKWVEGWDPAQTVNNTKQEQK